jgi:hypothetical protein
MLFFELVTPDLMAQCTAAGIHDQRAIRETDTHNRFSPFRYDVARVLGLTDDTLTTHEPFNIQPWACAFDSLAKFWFTYAPDLASAAIRLAVSVSILLRFSLGSVRRFLLSCRSASVRYLGLSSPDTSHVRAGKNTPRARVRCVKYGAVKTRCKGRHGTASEGHREHCSAFRLPG